MMLSQRHRSVTQPDSPDWLAAKKAGDIAVRLVAEWFRERGYDVLRSVGEDDAFDLQIQCRIEVKYDCQVSKTGNIAIEVSRDGEPSGIHTSSAVWWAIVTDDRCYLVRRSALLKLAAEHRQVPGGDRLATMVALVPVDRVTIAAVHVIALGEVSR